MSMKETMEQELAEAIATLNKANGALARIFGIEQEAECVDCGRITAECEADKLDCGQMREGE